MVSKSLKDLPQDIYDLLEGKSPIAPGLLSSSLLTGGPLPEDFGKSILDLLNYNNNKGSSEDKDKPTLRASNLGKPLRQLWFECHGYPGEPIEGKALLKFNYGHLIEDLVLMLAELAGHEVTRRQEEINVDGIVGHIDCVLDGVLIDIKSCSPHSFKKFKDGSLLLEGNDPFAYVAQASTYATALQLPFAWVAVEKVSGEICVLELPEERIKQYDIRSRIKLVRETVNSDEMPPRCFDDEPDGKSGNRTLCTTCSYCPYKETCWSDANDGKGLKLYFYSGKPRFLTKVVREPKVPSYDNPFNFPIKEE